MTQANIRIMFIKSSVSWDNARQQKGQYIISCVCRYTFQTKNRDLHCNLYENREIKTAGYVTRKIWKFYSSAIIQGFNNEITPHSETMGSQWYLRKLHNDIWFLLSEHGVKLSFRGWLSSVTGTDECVRTRRFSVVRKLWMFGHRRPIIRLNNMCFDGFRKT